LSIRTILGFPWHRWLVTGLSVWRPGFAALLVCVEFVVDKVALEQGFLLSSSVLPVNIIPPWLSMLTYHLRHGQQLVGGCSSQTLSHTIDMNMNKNDLILSFYPHTSLPRSSYIACSFITYIHTCIILSLYPSQKNFLGIHAETKIMLQEQMWKCCIY
jgi:hypothetical protein